MPYATGSTGLALTVRGSSRRIMIMRFRPANIRLINRRSNLPGLLLALFSGKNKSNGNYKNNHTDHAELTRSLHIRAYHSLTTATLDECIGDLSPFEENSRPKTILKLICSRPCGRRPTDYASEIDLGLA